MNHTIKLNFYDAYYFCNIIRNILCDQFSYLRKLNEFYGDGKFLCLVEPFQKKSAFHYFIEFVVEDIFYEDMAVDDLTRRKDDLRRFSTSPAALRDLKPTTLPIELALEFHKIKYESFISWLKNRNKKFSAANEDDVYGYMEDIRSSEAYNLLLQQTVKETFYVLFQNRNLMLLFNDMISGVIHQTEIEEIDDEWKPYFKKSGVLRRRQIPAWVRDAVFFRDRGHCVLCKENLSGTLNLSIKNYDHIIPLAHGGLNDITNIQLLCPDCNQKRKRDKYIVTSNIYEAWYHDDLD